MNKTMRPYNASLVNFLQEVHAREISALNMAYKARMPELPVGIIFITKHIFNIKQ